MENFKTLLILIIVVWFFGKLFRELKLPIIFGELIGGVVVGPLLLDLVSPDNEAVLILSELGIFFLMLHSGIETNPKELLKASKKSILIAIGGALLPFLGGFFVAKAFEQTFESALFIGMGLSITAIAISIRLFKEYKIQNLKIAHISIGAAIINDILALILFSVVMTIKKEGIVDWREIIFMIGKISLFFGTILFIGNHYAAYLSTFLKRKGFTLTLILALGLGLIAEFIGLHIILGAFLAGLFIQKELLSEKIYNKIEDRIYGLSYSFLGPIFFASLAFHLDFSALINTPLFLTLLLIVAFLGKILGAGGMAYLQKIKWQDSLIIGNAMNSRGAVELIIASIGFKEGLIGKDVFSILIFIAFTTTLISIFTMNPLVKLAKIHTKK